MNGPDRTPGRGIGRALLQFFSSFGLACMLLLLLLGLTWRGTLAQVDIGLHEAQKRYFDSFFFWQEVGGIPIPVPGAYLLLWILFLNLLVGGLIRLRRSPRTIGVAVTHVGIVVLLLAGLVKYHVGEEGAIRFHEGQTKAAFVSYLEWELAVGEPLADGRLREHVIPGEQFAHLRPSERTRFTSAALPFEVHLTGFLRNAQPIPEHAGDPRGQPVVDGFFLEPRDLSTEAEHNLAGAYVRAVPAAGGAPAEGILWGRPEVPPLTLTIAGRPYTFELRKRVFPLGWALRLDRFQKTDHPGTALAKDFRSWVTKIEGGQEETVEISMNEPLRHGGYIFYQSQYSEPDAQSNGAYYSILSVVRNPSDQWPLAACLIILTGMVIHFGQKLIRHARSENRIARTA